MIRSMTGFGEAEHARWRTALLRVQIKTVNHRFLNTSVRTPAGIRSGGARDPALAAGSHLSRGHVSISRSPSTARRRRATTCPGSIWPGPGRYCRACSGRCRDSLQLGRRRGRGLPAPVRTTSSRPRRRRNALPMDPELRCGRWWIEAARSVVSHAGGRRRARLRADMAQRLAAMHSVGCWITVEEPGAGAAGRQERDRLAGAVWPSWPRSDGGGRGSARAGEWRTSPRSGTSTRRSCGSAPTSNSSREAFAADEPVGKRSVVRGPGDAPGGEHHRQQGQRRPRSPTPRCR